MTKKNLVKDILISMVIPVIAGVSIYLLTLFLPDSLHVIKAVSAAYILTEASVVMFLFESKKIYRYLARIFFIGAIIAWIVLTFPVFYFYHVAKGLTVTMMILYFIIALIISIFTGKQKLSVYLWTFVSIFISGLLHYQALISLCYSGRLYAGLLFGGASVIMGFIFYYMIDIKKYHFRYSKVVRYILIFTSQILLSAASILMIS